MKRRRCLRSWTGLLAVVGGLVRFAPAAAQTVELPGQVLDASDRPVAGLEVLLHRVTSEGGALLARDTTDPDGRFLLRADAAEGEPVYFVATRYGDRLQIGPMLRAPFPASSEYVLRVRAAAAEGPPVAPARARPTGRTAAIVVIGLALIGISVAWAIRPVPRRALLVRLAQIEEARAAGDPAAHAPERGRLVARLRHGPGS